MSTLLPDAVKRRATGADSPYVATDANGTPHPAVDLRPDGASRPIRAARRFARWRWVAVPLLAGAMAGYRGAAGPADLYAFGNFGRAILTGHLSAAYATDFDQSGPLQLLAAATVPVSAFHTNWLLAIQAVWAALIAAGSMTLVRGLRRSNDEGPSPVHEIAAGLVTAVWVIGGYALIGHVAELAIPIAWVLAAIAAGRGRWVLAGLLIAGSAAVEPWGVLGVPLALLADRYRDAAKTVAMSAVATIACYLPFVLVGPFQMLHHHWPVTDASLVHWIWPHATQFGWLPRVLQAAVCLTLGALLALGLRRRPAAVWLVPAAILLARLVLDPVQFSYYWVAPQMALVAGIAFVEPRRRISTALLIATLWLVSSDLGQLQTVGAIGALALVVALALIERRYQPRVASRWSTGTSSTLMPTIASPSPRDTLAITSGSS
jgi:hypothetical protein